MDPIGRLSAQDDVPTRADDLLARDRSTTVPVQSTAVEPPIVDSAIVDYVTVEPPVADPASIESNAGAPWNAAEYYGSPLSDSPSRAFSDPPDPERLWVGLFESFHSLMERLNTTHDYVEALHALGDMMVDHLGFGLVGVAVARSDGMCDQVMLAGADEQIRSALMRPAPTWQLLRADQPYRSIGQWQYISHEDFQGWEGPYHASRTPKVDHPDAWHPNDHLRALLKDPAGRLIGLMEVDEPPGGLRPGTELMKILDIFAVQATTIVRTHIERTRLAREVAFVDLARKVTALALRSEPAEQLLRESAEMLAGAMGADRVGIKVYADGDVPELLVQTPSQGLAPSSALLRRLTEAAADRAWSDQRAIVVAAPEINPELVPAEDAEVLRAEMVARGAHSVLLSALGGAGKLIGYIVWIRDEQRLAWDDSERRAVEGITRDLASVVLNSRLALNERRHAESMRALDQRRRHLLATVSHDFRGPITAVVGNAELLEDDLAAGDLDDVDGRRGAARAVAAIARNAGRLAHMVDELLDIEQANAEDGDPDGHGVDLVLVVAEAIDTWRPQARERGVTLRPVGASEAVRVRGTGADIGHVVRNLISNAVKYSSRGGEVRLEVEAGETTVDLRCHDQGIGIASEDVPHLFDQFFRGNDAAVRQVPGNGLGLSIVQRTMTGLGGDITVESEPGNTVFTAHFLRAGVRREG